jgi:multidrug efflux system membrane fusion protein
MVLRSKDKDAGAEVLRVEHNSKLPLLGMLMCFPLTSCTRVSAKADVAATDAVPVRAVLAVSQDVPLEISAVGNVEAIASVEVKSRIAGQIKRVNFEEGQNVAKGQLLFTIDRDVLERQAVEQQAELERDLAIEQQAVAVVARDAASQKQSQSEADVAVKLGTLGVISGQRVNQLVTTSDTASAALHSDQAAVEAAVGATKADRARLAQTQLQLNFTDVGAPIAGRAGAVLVKAGNMVRDNDTTLVTVLQLAPIQVVFGIPEQNLSEVQRLNAGGQLTVEASNGDGSVIEGRLVFIDNTVDAATGTIRLKAVFSNTDNALWPGEFVNARLRLRMEKARTLVPESAIQNGQDGKYVWLVRSGIATVAPVTVLRTYELPGGPDLAVIGSGINPGDMIVTEGQLRLTAGARISLPDMPRIQPSAPGMMHPQG